MSGIFAFCIGCETLQAPFIALEDSLTSRQDASTQALLDDLTPDMHGLAENHDENDAGVALTKNTEWRQFDDDLRRALLLDRPSSLSPYPVIDN